MPYYGALEVIDRTGWTKTYPLEKALLMIGSADFNDIVLSDEHGLGVAPAHLQVMRPALELGSIRVVNLSAAPVTLLKSDRPEGSLPGGGTAELSDGDGLLLAECRLTFTIQSQGGLVRSARSEHLGLKLELPGGSLRPFKQLAGRLTVTNYGSQPRCQFELDLDGLPADCYQIDPAPLLFPRGEAQMQIRFFHNGTRPAGGPQALALRAAAPGAYPTEEITLAWDLDVAPVQSIQSVLDSDPLAPWEHETQRAVAQPPTVEARTMPVFLPLAVPVTPAPAAPEPVAPPPADPGEPPDPVSEFFESPTVEETPVLVPAPAEDTDWWQSAPETADAPAPQPAPVRSGAPRRLRPRLDGQKISVLRLTPDQVTGEGEGNEPPSLDTGEDAH